jgi:hypothetical protein
MFDRARFAKLGDRLPAAFAALCVLARLTLSCGAADSVRAARPDDPPDVGVESQINSCPSFAFSLVLPKQIAAGEIATVAAFAIDPDSDDTQLGYVWSATSGDFAAPTASLTEYTCTESGPQVLRVTTSDPDGCENNLDLDVTCETP